MCVCARVCGRKRETEREGETNRDGETNREEETKIEGEKEWTEKIRGAHEDPLRREAEREKDIRQSERGKTKITS